MGRGNKHGGNNTPTKKKNLQYLRVSFIVWGEERLRWNVEDPLARAQALQMYDCLPNKGCNMGFLKDVGEKV